MKTWNGRLHSVVSKMSPYQYTFEYYSQPSVGQEFVNNENMTSSMSTAESCDQYSSFSPISDYQHPSYDGVYYNSNYNSGVQSSNYSGFAHPFAPCNTPKPWDFGYCYGSYGDSACQMANLVDMEDFM